MKTIYLLRHAKSSWNDPSLADFDRPLNDRGRNAAEFMGAYMNERDLRPQAIVCSPAKRAKETALLVRSSAGWENEIRFDQRIYEASPATLWDVLTEQLAENESVLLIGHNPGIEMLIERTTRQACTVPTATLAVISCRFETMPETGIPMCELKALIRPKDEMRRSDNNRNN